MGHADFVSSPITIRLSDRYLCGGMTRFVGVGICTHLGCSPTFRPDIAPADLGPEWLGGFFCPCHQSKFDLAGRVFKGVPAPTNLVVPPHKYDAAGTQVTIGEDTKSA